MRRLDFSPSAQRLGVRFTHKLRSACRARWLRLRHEKTVRSSPEG